MKLMVKMVKIVIDKEVNCKDLSQFFVKRSMNLTSY